MSGPPDLDAVAFAERLLAVLDEGRFTATYKHAVLLSLIDCCLERTGPDGDPPAIIPTADLAEKVVALYWGQAGEFPGHGRSAVLWQNSGGRQAEIVSRVAAHRARFAPHPPPSAARARALDPAGFDRLVAFVEWKLIEMPLPRLQVLGDREEPFIYRRPWGAGVRRQGDVAAIPRHVELIGRAGEHLVRLAGLLRPIVQREWAALVARFNRELIEDALLEEFLFGAGRVPLAPLRPGLRELQDRRCFYCDDRLTTPGDVDHFLPWSRHPDNGIENLVVAHPRCNGAKRDHLAAPEHLGRWAERLRPPARDALAELARRAHWERHPERTLAAVRGVYLRLPADARLWRAGADFVPADPGAIRRALADRP